MLCVAVMWNEQRKHCLGSGWLVPAQDVPTEHPHAWSGCPVCHKRGSWRLGAQCCRAATAGSVQRHHSCDFYKMQFKCFKF